MPASATTTGRTTRSTSSIALRRPSWGFSPSASSTRSIAAVAAAWRHPRPARTRRRVTSFFPAARSGRCCGAACCRRPSSAVPKWCRFWRTDYVRYSYDSNDGAHHAAPHHRLLPQGHGGGAAGGLGRGAGGPLVGRGSEMRGEKPLSGVERIKQQSNGLRGEVAAELAQGTTNVSDESAQLLKFHGDRKSTRLNSSHGYISYAVFCLKKKKKTEAV